MNIAAFRNPGSKNIKILQLGQPTELKNTLLDSPVSDGYVVSSFNPEEDTLFYPVIKELDAIPKDIVEINEVLSSGYKEFTREEYDQYLNCIINALEDSEDEKIVAARRKVVNKSVQPAELLEALCEKYPLVYVYLISTERFGTWIGATPELLLKREGSNLTSMALAGTRHKDDQDGEWDNKNIKEQKIVTDHICAVFEEFQLNADCSKLRTVNAGPVEHLQTLVTGIGLAQNRLNKLLGKLAPTPALSGYPRKKALNLITEFEGSRGLYGGFAGMMKENGDFDFYVLIRCALLQKDKIILFAGGGITCHSEIEKEWEETENKFETLRSIIR